MRRLLLPLVVVAALVPACGGSAEPEGSPMTPAATTTAAEETTTEAETTPETAPPAEEPKKRKAKGKAPPGVPRFVAGYRGWLKLNERPLPPRDADPHSGTKDVFASKRPGGDGRFPDGTVVVKEATRPGTDFVGLIAIMRKERGADPEHNDWVFVEYTREAAGARFGFQAEGAVCYGCHVGARETDYVFTLGLGR